MSSTRRVQVIGSAAAFALVATMVQPAASVANTGRDKAADRAADIVGDFGKPLAVQTWPVPTGSAGLASAGQGPTFGQGGIVSWNGALWFAEEEAGKLGRIDTAGNITELAMPAPTSNPGYGPRQLSAGPAGLWFLADGEALDGRAARLNTAATSVEGFYDVPGYARFGSLAATPDGGAWITDRYGEGITRLTPTGEVQAYFGSVTYAGEPESTLGPDGHHWFSDGSSVISRITDAGAVTSFAATGQDGDIVSMTTSGGSVWYAKFNPGTFFSPSRSGVVAKMSPGGVATPFTSPYPDLLPAGLTPAADGGVWFTTHQGGGIGHVDPSGTYRVALMPDGQAADSVAVGPDGNLWFTDHDLNRVGRVTVADFAASIASQSSNPPPGGTGGTNKGPRATLAGKKGTIAKNRAAIRVKCPKGSSKCRGKAVVTKNKRIVAKGSFVVRGGKTKTVKVKLTKPGRKYFRGHRKARLKVVLKSRGGSSQRTVVFRRKR